MHMHAAFSFLFLSLNSLSLSSEIRSFPLREAPAIYPSMASHDKNRPLPKFGEWDVNNPASADGFTVIFAKARDDKKSTGTAANMAAPPPHRNNPQRQEQNYQYPKKGTKWFCCC